MNPLLLAVRAVSSEFARRIYLPLVWIVGVILIALIVLLSWLTTIEVWWWIGLVPVILFSVAYILVAGIVGAAILLLRPKQTKQQRKDVSRLVDRLQQVSETVQTPKLFLLLRLAKDVLFPNGQGLVGEMTAHATSLKPDFQAIIASFK